VSRDPWAEIAYVPPTESIVDLDTIRVADEQRRGRQLMVDSAHTPDPDNLPLDGLLSDEVPMIRRPTRDKAAAMLADAGTYIAICRAQRHAEAADEPIPCDRDALAAVRAEEDE
jgi:hypothetical protein